MRKRNKNVSGLEDVILFISPDATRTGAPLLLLNNLKWINKHASYKYVFLFRTGGALIDEFKILGKVYIWDDFKTVSVSSNRFRLSILRVWRKIAGIKKNLFLFLFLIELKQRYNIRLIYANTLLNGQILSVLLKYISCKILTHVHEGERLLDENNKQGQINYAIDVSNQFVAVSNLLRKVLKEKYNIEKGITVIPGAINHNNTFRLDKKVLLNEEKIPENAFIIMTCGYPGWHKGMDFFMQVSRMLSSYKDQHLYFIWLGGNENDIAYDQLMFDIYKLGLTNHVSIITSKENVLDYINIADIFLMLSRDESFSLVTIEAGLACKPVLCFEGSGGPCEILDFDSRFMIPYADVNKLSQRIVSLVENEEERKQMGNFINEKVISNYTIEKTASSLLNVINNQLQ